MNVRSFEVIVSENSYIDGYDIIELGNDFEFSFPKYNISPRNIVNRFLSNVTNLSDRLANEAIQQAIKNVKEIASSKGWNGVINFGVDFEDIGEYASINCVNVHVYGTFCCLTPQKNVNQNSFNQYCSTQSSYNIPKERSITCWKCGRTFTCSDNGIYFRCPFCDSINEVR